MKHVYAMLRSDGAVKVGISDFPARRVKAVRADIVNLPIGRTRTVDEALAADRVQR